MDFSSNLTCYDNCYVLSPLLEILHNIVMAYACTTNFYKQKNRWSARHQNGIWCSCENSYGMKNILCCSLGLLYHPCLAVPLFSWRITASRFCKMYRSIMMLAKQAYVNAVMQYKIEYGVITSDIFKARSRDQEHGLVITSFYVSGV